MNNLKFNLGEKVIVNTGGNDSFATIVMPQKNNIHGYHWEEQDFYLCKFENNTTQYINSKYLKKNNHEQI